MFRDLRTQFTDLFLVSEILENKQAAQSAE